MSKLYLEPTQLQRWWHDRGDDFLIIDYDLNQDSVVMDLGGYTGTWIKRIVGLYDCHAYVIEPLPQYYHTMVKDFKDNLKVHLLNVGVASTDKSDYIYINHDSSSSMSGGASAQLVNFQSMNTLLAGWNLKEVDLLQMNIEGDEYSVLEAMISDKTILKVKNIQVQFHLGVPHAETRRAQICADLARLGFVARFSYPFVWESWTRTNTQ